MKKTDFSMLYIPCSSLEEARKIGKCLVELRLAACANIVPQIHSIYRWQGDLQEESEVLLLVKTRKARVAQATEKVESLHSYDCPCVVALVLDEANEAYLRWLWSETE